MLNLICEIWLYKGNTDEVKRVANYVEQITISQNADSFTKTAFIQLPQRLYDNSRNNLFDIIAIGDKVVIKLGYNQTLTTRFVGFVTKRVPNSPLEVYCEDYAWLYKQRYLEPITQEDTTLKSFIKAIYTGATYIFDEDRKIGSWRIQGATTFIKVLENLRNTFGLSAFWDEEGILYIDSQLATNSLMKARFYYASDKGNIIDTTNMYYQDAGEFLQVVHGISEQETLTDGKPDKPIEVYSYYDENGVIKSNEAFDGYGNINTFKIPYLTFDELKKLTETKLQNINFTGFRGSFTTFGVPVIEVNDDIEIQNNRQTEMNGRYRVKSVNIDFGANTGYRQEIEVTRKTGEIENN